MMLLVGDMGRQICLSSKMNTLYSHCSLYRYDSFPGSGPSCVKHFRQSSGTSGHRCMQLLVSFQVKSCGMVWFNLLINNIIISFFVINGIRKKPIRSRQVQVHKLNNTI